MTSERRFNSFYPPPKTFIPPKQISGYAPAVQQCIVNFIVQQCSSSFQYCLTTFKNTSSAGNDSCLWVVSPEPTKWSGWIHLPSGNYIYKMSPFSWELGQLIRHGCPSCWWLQEMFSPTHVQSSGHVEHVGSLWIKDMLLSVSVVIVGLVDGAQHSQLRIYLLVFWDKHKEQSTNWDSTDSAPRLPVKHLLARFHLQPVHIVVINGDETAKHLLLLSAKWAAECQRYFRDSIDITDVFQDYESLVEFHISSGHLPPPPYIGSAWQARHDNNNNNNSNSSSLLQRCV